MDRIVHVRLSDAACERLEERKQQLAEKQGVTVSVSAIVRGIVEGALGVPKHTGKSAEERKAVARKAVRSRKRNAAAKKEA